MIMKKIFFTLLSLVVVSFCIVPLNVLAFEQKEVNLPEITDTLEENSQKEENAGSTFVANRNVAGQGRSFFVPCSEIHMNSAKLVSEVKKFHYMC
jgi:hypothetical protein